jgi:acid phosphatase type 7
MCSLAGWIFLERPDRLPVPMTRGRIILGLLILTFGLWMHASETNVHPKNPFIVRGPYLQLATPNSIFVVWRTETNIQPNVRFGLAPGRLDRVVKGNEIIVRYGTTNKTLPGPRIGKLHSAPEGTWQYEARIGGLRPDTQYYYGVYDGDLRLTPEDGTYYFRTHPIKGARRPMRFWVVGDSGTGREMQSAVHLAMLDQINRERQPLDFYLHLGDMAYSRGRDVEFQTRFFEMYDTTLRNVVCWPTMGNHEGATSKGTNGIGPYYDAYVLPTRAEAGGVASGLEAFYSFDYGRAHFICLDSHDLDRRPTALMARWLKQDLEKAKADWLIAYFHHPPYTKGSHDSDREKQLIEMRTHIVPILEWGGVDLVLTGHSHIYERSMLMDGAYATPTVAEYVIYDDREGNPRTSGPYQKSQGITPHGGTIQVVAGHGGTTIRRKGTMPVMRKIILEHGSVIIDIDGDTLTGTMIDKYGEERDRFGLVKRGRVLHQRIAQPWQPDPWKPPPNPRGDGSSEPPEDYIVAIPQNAEWRYLAGTHPPTNWTQLNFRGLAWTIGQAGFGYGDNDDRTVLTNMQGRYSTVYVRHMFDVEQADHITELGLMINYDDAFVAYLNGKEVARVGMKGSGRNSYDLKTHNATGKFSYFPLKDFEKYLRTGANVLAIEGHNSKVDSTDFTLDPFLVIED